MKILLFCCKGFEMMEFAPFYDTAGWASSEYGYDIKMDTCGFESNVKSAFWNTEIRVFPIYSSLLVISWLFGVLIITTGNPECVRSADAIFFELYIVPATRFFACIVVE